MYGLPSLFLTDLRTDKPRLRRRSVRKFGGALGERCRLSCVVHSIPPPRSFHWVDTTNTNISRSSAYIVSTAANSSVLTVESVARTDYGAFTCVATNDVGSGRFQLSLQPPGTDCMGCIGVHDIIIYQRNIHNISNGTKSVTLHYDEAYRGSVNKLYCTVIDISKVRQ